MKRLWVVVAVALACAEKKPTEVSPVKTVNVTLPTGLLLVGSSLQANAALFDAQGNPVLDVSPSWTSLTPTVASVSATGLVTGLQPGTATVRATAGAASGDGQLTVRNPTAASIILSRDTATISIPNGAFQLVPTVLDVNGNVIVNPTIFWQSTKPLIATVNFSGLVTGVAVGSTTIRATIDGRSAEATITVRATPNASAPLIVSIDPLPMRPGGTYTLTGNNFAATPAGNVVVVDGVPATVNAGNPNAMSITVAQAGFSCEPTRPVFVQVSVNGFIGGGNGTLQVATARTLAPGQSLVVTNPAEVRCNELSQTGGRYVLSVFNAYRTAVQPGAAGSLTVSLRGALGASSAVAAASTTRQPASLAWAGGGPRIGGAAFDVAGMLRRAREADAAHERLLERNVEFLRSNAAAIRALRPLAARAPASGPSATFAAQIATVGAVTPVKLPNIDAAAFCSSNVPIGVRTVFVGQRAIIVEDTSTVFNGKTTLAGQMNDYFARLGQEFDEVMWPILTTNFGNPLAMDARLSGTGKVIMVFSPRVNAFQAGRVLGFVVSCDFSPVATAPSSNFGEYFYAAVPTNPAPGYSLNQDTRDSWMQQMRATVIHEVKHITAFGERLARDPPLPFEDISWEEGMARNVEELYARTFYGNQAKGNSGYAVSVGCDLKFADATPPCADRPLLMLRHFDALYSYLSSPDSYSPLGRTFSADATFYASAWALERWASDHFAASESQFLRDFTVSPVTGVQNLEARTGRPWEEMLGEWSLALYLDEEPGFTPENPRLRFPSWNLRDIWLGLCSDLGPCVNPNNTPQLFPRAAPAVPRNLTFGVFNVGTGQVAGGSFTLFELAGAQSGKQVIEIRSATGGDPPVNTRLAIVRVQ